MPKPTFREIQNFGDPLQSDFFELIFPEIPGGGDSAALRVQCQQVILPAKMIEPVMVELAGNQSGHAGRSLYNHQISATFVEDRTMKVHKAFKRWLEFVRRHETQTGNFKAQYAKTATLTVFDQTGGVVDVFDLENVWPENVPDVQFDGSSSQPIIYQVTLQCDKWEPV